MRAVSTDSKGNTPAKVCQKTSCLPGRIKTKSCLEKKRLRYRDGCLGRGQLGTAVGRIQGSKRQGGSEKRKMALLPRKQQSQGRAQLMDSRSI